MLRFNDISSTRTGKCSQFRETSPQPTRETTAPEGRGGDTHALRSSQMYCPWKFAHDLLLLLNKVVSRNSHVRISSPGSPSSLLSNIPSEDICSFPYVPSSQWSHLTLPPKLQTLIVTPPPPPHEFGLARKRMEEMARVSFWFYLSLFIKFLTEYTQNSLATCWMPKAMTRLSQISILIFL